MKMIPIAALTVTAGLLLGPAWAYQGTPHAPEHSVPTPQHGEMMDHDKMMADVKAADARLDALAKKMKSTAGNDKVRVMEELLTDLVRNQVDMHRHMSTMHDHMMSQMPHK